jgi:ribosomal protein S18 acetylase RimI-like enzyme
MASQMSTETAAIRPVQIRDVAIVRELLLRMLTDSPQAFGETLAEAQARDEVEWRQYVENAILRPYHSAFISIDEQGTCGFVTGDAANPQTPPNTVLVSRLWVAPHQRGTGLGRRLMDTITEWAKEQGAQLIGLGVTEMNLNAMKFYEHLGYIDTGLRFPLPGDPTKQIIILGRSL